MESYLDKKYLAEFIGTLALILIGCGAITIGGFGGIFPIGILPIALAFGLTVVGMAYGLGPISGAHLNPAVTVAVWCAGRMETRDVLPYIIAQLVGGIVGALILVAILKGKAGGYDVGKSGLGQTGWATYGVLAAILVEFVATFLFTMVILGATSAKGTTPVAGLIIGLTLVVLHFPFINVTGLSVNPARSLGPAVFVGGTAIAQLWLFLVVPTLAGAAAGWLFKSKVLEA
jgi:aquaporin Z